MPLHTQQLGNGKDIVLLHGWGMHSGIFRPLVEMLVDDYRVTLIDLPGHGLSADVEDDAVDAYIDALLAVAPPNAAWIGWSLGGILAVSFASRYPDRVKQLGMLASSPKFTASDDWINAMQGDVLAGFGTSLSQDAEATIKRFLSLVARGAPDQSVLRSLRDQVLAGGLPTSAGLSRGLHLLESLDLRQAFSELKMPTMVVLGERDTLVPNGVLDDMKKLNNGLIAHEITQAGHAPFLSHTGRCVQLLKDFIQ